MKSTLAISSLLSLFLLQPCLAGTPEASPGPSAGGRLEAALAEPSAKSEVAVGSADEVPKFLSFEEAARVALNSNPDLEGLRHQQEAAALRSRQVLAPNNPVFTFASQDGPSLSPFVEPASRTYSIQFTLGFPGKALSQSASLQHQVESLSEQSLSMEINLLTTLSNLYVSFEVNEKTREILEDATLRDRQLTKLLEKKYGAAQAAQVDVLNQRVIVAQDEQAILANQNEKVSLITQFRNLLKKPRDRSIYPKIPREIVIPRLGREFDDLVVLMERNQHLILSSEHQVESAESALTNASLAPLPDFQLTGATTSWMQGASAPIPGLLRDYSFSVGVAVPIFFPFNELTGIRAAHQDLATQTSALDSQRLQAEAALQIAYTGFVATKKETENLEKLVYPATKSAFDLTRLSFSMGKADFFMLNVARQAWIQSQKDLLTHKQALATLFNQLVQQVGCDFQKTEGPHACH